MKMSLTELISNHVLTGIFCGALALFVRLWINELRKRLQTVEDSTSKKLDTIDLQLARMTEKVSSVLDTMLNKFSNWEDRIRNLLDVELLNKAKSKDGGVDLYQVESLFINLTKNTKEDILNLKDTMSEVSGEMSKLDSRVKQTQRLDNNTHKERIHELTVSIAKLKTMMENTVANDIVSSIDKNHERIRQSYELMAKFNKKIGEQDNKIDRLSQAGRVTLFKNKDKKKDV